MTNSHAVEAGPLRGLIDQYFEAWRGSTSDKVLKYFSDDAVVTLLGDGATLTGKKMVGERWIIPMMKKYSNNTHHITSFIEAGDRVAVEWLFTAVKFFGKIIPEAQSFGLLPPLEIVGSESFNFLFNQLHPYANEPLPSAHRTVSGTTSLQQRYFEQQKCLRSEMGFFSSQIRITRIMRENRSLLATVIDPLHHHNDSAEHHHNRDNSRHCSLRLWNKYWDSVCELRSSPICYQV